jgi:hypothetical protein
MNGEISCVNFGVRSQFITNDILCKMQEKISTQQNTKTI